MERYNFEKTHNMCFYWKHILFEPQNKVTKKTIPSRFPNFFVSVHFQKIAKVIWKAIVLKKYTLCVFSWKHTLLNQKTHWSKKQNFKKWQHLVSFRTVNTNILLSKHLGFYQRRIHINCWSQSPWALLRTVHNNLKNNTNKTKVKEKVLKCWRVLKKVISENPG